MIVDALWSIHLPSSDYGDVYVAAIPATEGKWGVLNPLRGTIWEQFIPIVPGDIMSMARRGFVRPLMQIIGRPPAANLTLIPQPWRTCAEHKTCASFNADICQPCSKVPDCYTPPGMEPEAQAAARLVTLAWREGRYVVVVEGPEFV